jgi:arylsulfatase A-like enzyme
MRTPIRSLAAFGLCWGAASGAAEVALRVSARQGLQVADVATWLAVSVGLASGFGLVLAGGAWAIGHTPFLKRNGARHGHGLVFAGFVGMHAAINYRFELVLNEFVRDPKVWGGIGLLLAAALGLGFVADRWLHQFRRPLGSFLLGVAVVGSAIAFPRALGTPGQPGDKPSIVVISLDTTRFDHLSPYGYGIDTPNLARLAREGTVFDQAVAAAPITEPSHLAMFTGRPPVATGVVSNGTDLGDRPELLWRTLDAGGYLTAGFIAGFPLHGKYGWGQGMQVYDDDFGRVAGVQSLSLVKLWNQVAIKEHALRERSADAVLARALPWIRAHAGEQTFTWVHFYDAHGPYDAPDNAALGAPPTDGAPLALPGYWPAPARAITSTDWLTRAYDNEIHLTDAAVGRVLDAIGPALDHTVVVVIADHGESLTEHGYLFDHGDDLYDPSLRVPWIVRYPPSVNAGQRVECQVGGIDLTPTVLALAGVTDRTEREGVSRAPELGGAPCREEPVLASTVAGRLMTDPPTDHALRARGMKLIRHEDARWEVYQLGDDPGEQVNLAPQEVSGLLGKLLESRISSGTTLSPELDPQTADMLHQLGYIDQ